MARRSSNAHPVRRAEPDDAASADGAVDPYDPAYIFRSIFGGKMKGHWQTWPFIDVDELRQINPDCVGWVHMDASPIDYPVVKQRFDLFWWRDGNDEVDFVAAQGDDVVAIEVEGGRVKGLGGLVAFQNRFPAAHKLVVGSASCPLNEFLRGKVRIFA